MKITINVPEMKCARCSTSAPIQPHLLYFRGQTPPQFREALSAITRERSDLSAKDDADHDWMVLADDKPVGWVKGPVDSNLCAPCGALWADAGKQFLVPPPAPIVIEDQPNDEANQRQEAKPEPPAFAPLPPNGEPRKKQQLHGARHR